MVEEVARVGAQWGVSLVSAVRDSEQSDNCHGRGVQEILQQKAEGLPRPILEQLRLPDLQTLPSLRGTVRGTPVI